MSLGKDPGGLATLRLIGPRIGRTASHSAQVGSLRMSPYAPPGTKPAKILLVDDDPELALALTPHLEGCGWAARYARDCEEALRLADDGFDLAVVDMMLPRLSGFQVVQHLRARFGPGVPILMTSEFDAPEHRAYASLVGVSSFLAKPFALDQFLGLLARLLACPAR
jgi:DNA-binding response OmpR family regulator